MADMIPFHFPAQTLTCHASAAVIGRRFVNVSGAPTDEAPTVAPATTADILGVAAQDAALGERVTVFTIGHLAVEAGGVVAAGARVTVDASGRAIAAAGALGATVAFVGKATRAAAAAGDVISVFIDRGAFVA